MKTVLVLQDEPGVEFLRNALRQYTVIEATTAEQALHLFKTHARQVDLLIADLTLPKSSGIQVACLLRSELPDLPVILTSGYPVSDWSVRDYSDLQRAGATSVALLSKPFQIQELLNRVDELIGGAASEIAGTA